MPYASALIPATHRHFHGLVDEVSVYNRALTAPEIQAIYNAGSAGKCFTPAPPTILAPLANQTAPEGGAATFSVYATGAPPLSYQWRFNGEDIAGATDATLTLSDVQYNQVGVYSVRVSNPSGSVLSSDATLEISLPSLVQNGGFETGDFTSWNLDGDWSFVAADWLCTHSGTDGAVLLSWYETFESISQTFTTTAGQEYLVSCWFYNRDPYQPDDTPNEFFISWDGTTIFDQQDIGVTPWVNLQFVVTATDANTELTFGVHNDVWCFGLDDVAVYPLIGQPMITTQPATQSVSAGNTAMFTVAAGGGSLSYQWKLNGSDLTDDGRISGSNTPNLDISNVSTADVGTYTVVVSNSVGTVTSSNATLTVQ